MKIWAFFKWQWEYKWILSCFFLYTSVIGTNRFADKIGKKKLDSKKFLSKHLTFFELIWSQWSDCFCSIELLNEKLNSRKKKHKDVSRRQLENENNSENHVQNSDLAASQNFGNHAEDSQNDENHEDDYEDPSLNQHSVYFDVSLIIKTKTRKTRDFRNIWIGWINELNNKQLTDYFFHHIVRNSMNLMGLQNLILRSFSNLLIFV